MTLKYLQNFKHYFIKQGLFMKNIGIIIVGICLISFSSCKRKETLDRDTNTFKETNSNSSYLKFTGTEYNELTSSLKNEFSGPKSEVSGDVGALKVPANLSSKAIPVNFQELAHESNRILDKYEKLKGFNSLLRIYNDAHILNDTNTFKELAIKYSKFFLYFPEIKHLSLTISKHNAATLSPYGIIQINDEVTFINDHSSQTIKETDPRKEAIIDSVCKTSKKSFSQKRPVYVPQTYIICSTDNNHKAWLYKTTQYEWADVMIFWGVTESITVQNNTVVPVYALIVEQSVFGDAYNSSVIGPFLRICNSSNGLFNVYYISTECHPNYAAQYMPNPPTIHGRVTAHFYDGHILVGQNF